MTKYSVLLVDDHKLFREGLKVLLENLTYVDHVMDASNGVDFIKLIEKNQPDIVLWILKCLKWMGLRQQEKH